MNRWKAMTKRISAVLLAALLVLNSADYGTLSVAAAAEGTTAICQNHTEHTEDCGYVEAAEGAECMHEHTDDCYKAVTDCVHEHGEECYESSLTCENTEEGHTHTEECSEKALICTHECSEESGCIGQELVCTHVHDENCGYREAVKGQPCTHSCELCAKAAEGSAPAGAADEKAALAAVQADAGTPVANSVITSWTELQAAFENGGDYVLGGDVESTDDSRKGRLEVPAGVTVTLDLAGHTVDRSMDSPLSEGQVMKILGTLTVDDTVGGGIITGGYGSGIDMRGAAVYVPTGGSFTLNGGSISGNKTSMGNQATGVGVDNNATFIMNGGSICNNTGENSSSLGGGVGANSSATVKLLGGSIENNSVGGSNGGGLFFYGNNVTVGGSVVIKDNTAKGGITSNVASTKSNPVLLLSEDVPLTEDAEIGWTVSTYSGVVASANGTPVAKGKNAADYVDNFFSDQDATYIFGVKADDAETIYIATADSTVVSKPSAPPAETQEHDGKTFVPWSASSIKDLGNGNSNILAGSYYLTEDVKAGTELIVSSATVDICLNGHTFDLNGKVIFLESGATLNIYDCDANDSIGKITNGGGHNAGSNQKGGAIYVKGSTLNLYGGSLEENSADWGGAIFIDASEATSTVNMYGGVIQNNTTRYGGGGIEVEDDQSYLNMYGGSIINNQVETVDGNRHKGGGVHFNKIGMTIDGTVNISGNTVAGVESNVYLRPGRSITVNSIGEGSRIGVSASDIEDRTTLQTYTITSGYGTKISASAIEYFFLDGTHSKSQYALTHSGTELQIEKHTHTWEYAAGTGDDANKLYAYCVTDTSKCEYFGETCTSLPLVITAQSPFTYTGSAYDGAKLSAAELSRFNAETGKSLSDADIKYCKDAELSEMTSVEDGAAGNGAAPVKAGTYYAAVRVEGKKIKAEFTIQPADLSLTPTSWYPDAVGDTLTLTAVIPADFDEAEWYSAEDYIEFASGADLRKGGEDTSIDTTVTVTLKKPYWGTVGILAKSGEDEEDVSCDVRAGNQVMINPANHWDGTKDEYTFENTYTLPDFEDYSFKIPTGQQFKAWKVNGTEYQPGQTITFSGIDGEKYTSQIITAVWEDAPAKITDISISPSTDVSVNKGETKQFTATVSGTGAYDSAVTWTIANANSTGTTISADGLLTVGEDETASSIMVVATSKSDTEKSCRVDVQIPQTTALSLTPNSWYPDAVGDTLTLTAVIPADFDVADWQSEEDYIAFDPGTDLHKGGEDTSIDTTVKVTLKQPCWGYVRITGFKNGEVAQTAGCLVKAGNLITIDPYNQSDDSVREYTFSNTYTLPDYEDYSFAIPTGYKFKAWKVNGTEYQPGQMITLSGIDGEKYTSKSITAVWEHVPTRIIDISISPSTAALQQGETKQFTATVIGSGSFDRTVSWTIENANSTGTTISADGLLTVGADETADTITVKATANGDGTVEASATVTIAHGQVAAPVVGGIKDGGKYCESVSFTVAGAALDKVLIDGTVVIPDANGRYTITADNDSHTVTVKDTAGNTTNYTVTVYTGHDFEQPVYTETGRDGNVITEEGICGHGCEKKIVRKRTPEGDIISQEYPNDSGSNGSLATEVKVEADAPATSVAGLDIEVAKALLDSATELPQVESGEKLLVYLKVNRLEESAVPAGDKTQTEERAAAIRNLQQGIYLDLSMWKKIGAADEVQLMNAETAKELTITVTLPEELRAPAGKVRTYYVIRVHNGAATVLPVKLKGNTISFKTDLFSTYSIWYADSRAVHNSSDNTSDTPEILLTNKADESGKPGKWVQDAAGWWFSYDAGGYSANSWELINNKWYYFGSDGYMKAGSWVAGDQVWYYCKADGAMAESEWIYDNGAWYYLGAGGSMTTNGWVLYQNEWYYLKADGVMAKSEWIYDNGAWYYLGADDVMAANRWILYQNEWYYLKADGVMAESEWIYDNGAWYYLGADGVMAADEVTPDGYQVDAAGAWVQK